MSLLSLIDITQALKILKVHRALLIHKMDRFSGEDSISHSHFGYSNAHSCKSLDPTCWQFYIMTVLAQD